MSASPKKVKSIATKQKLVHLAAPGDADTFCGRRSLATLTSSKGLEVTCQACFDGFRKKQDEDSQRRWRQRNELERVCERAYNVYQHRSGAPPVPFQHLSQQEQMAWREVVEYVVDECDDGILEILRPKE